MLAVLAGVGKDPLGCWMPWQLTAASLTLSQAKFIGKASECSGKQHVLAAV